MAHPLSPAMHLPEPNEPQRDDPQGRVSRSWLPGLALAVAIVILLGSAGVIWFRWFDKPPSSGASRPEITVDRFLGAVFQQRNAQAAERLTCPSAQDGSALRRRVNQLREFDLRYQSPSYSWPSPTVESQHRGRAVVFAQVRMMTADDRISWQRLRFITIRSSGWLVCEINMA
jgi:hypothetical protein